ncbi:MAG: hypothetical protein WCB31_10250 [Nitrososphaeraceae archaeon]
MLNNSIDRSIGVTDEMEKEVDKTNQYQKSYGSKLLHDKVAIGVHGAIGSQIARKFSKGDNGFPLRTTCPMIVES